MGDYRSTAATGARPLGTSIPGQLALLLWHAVEVHTGSQWRHRPNEYGKWNSVFRRYRQWVETDVFDAMLQTLAELAGADNAAHLIDGTIIPAHYCAVGKKWYSKSRSPRPLARQLLDRNQRALRLHRAHVQQAQELAPRRNAIGQDG
jgi:transposase